MPLQIVITIEEKKNNSLEIDIVAKPPEEPVTESERGASLLFRQTIDRTIATILHRTDGTLLEVNGRNKFTQAEISAQQIAMKRLLKNRGERP